MNVDHRLAISKKSGTRDRAFRAAIRARGFTQNGLAKALGVSTTVMSFHRNALRQIPRARAERVAALTGWPADRRHWPCGIVDSQK